jgi:hypothetical protein
MRMETPGFIVLGPDYFFGVPVQNLQPDRDKIAWSLEARAAAVEVFPKWFERAKATYGGAPPTSRPSDTLLSCFCFLGVETTKYIAVGKCATVARFVEGSNRRMSFQATVSAHRSCWIWPQRGLLWQVPCFPWTQITKLSLRAHAGAIAHPGFLEDSHFQKLTSMTSKQRVSISFTHIGTGPLLLSCAGEIQQ